MSRRYNQEHTESLQESLAEAEATISRLKILNGALLAACKEALYLINDRAPDDLDAETAVILDRLEKAIEKAEGQSEGAQ